MVTSYADYGSWRGTEGTYLAIDLVAELKRRKKTYVLFSVREESGRTLAAEITLGAVAELRDALTRILEEEAVDVPRADGAGSPGVQPEREGELGGGDGSGEDASEAGAREALHGGVHGDLREALAAGDEGARAGGVGAGRDGAPLEAVRDMSFYGIFGRLAHDLVFRAPPLVVFSPAIVVFIGKANDALFDMMVDELQQMRRRTDVYLERPAWIEFHFADAPNIMVRRGDAPGEDP